MRGDPCRYRVDVTPSHQRVDEAIAQRPDLVIGEAHTSEVRPVGRECAEEAERPSGDLASPLWVGLEHKELLNGQGGVVAQARPGLRGVLRGHENGKRAGGAAAGELEHAGAECGEDAGGGGNRVQLIQIGVQRLQRVGAVRSAETDDEAVRIGRASCRERV